ncbi:MAG: phosphotransferase [Candidatus Dormiibacterota bacterium]
MARIARIYRESENAKAAHGFLRRRFGEGVEMGDDLPQGAWSRAYAFRHAGRDLVARFNPDRHAFDADRLALRFASPALPIPDVLEIGKADGDDYYAISDRCSGDFLEDLGLERTEAAVPSLLATLDALRTADTSGSQGFGPWDEKGNGRNRDWSEFLIAVDAGMPEAFRDTWRRNLRRSEVAERTFGEGMRELEALSWRCPSRRDLVHSDLLHGNVFVSGSRITGLIDWQSALYGDHLYELAWLAFCAPPWAPGLAAADLPGRALDHWRADEVDLTDFDVRLRCYQIRIGVAALVGLTWRRDLPNRELAARRLAEVLG